MEILLSILGGLGLFLFAVSNLSSVLSSAIGTRAKDFLKRYVNNLFTAVLAGVLITILLDSSSAVIILTIVLVNARVLTFRQAIGIVLGANIGTTFSSQLIAFDIGKFSPIPIFIGLILGFFSKSEQLSKGARALLYFGILFFGLYTMERSVEPLRESPVLIRWMAMLENPVAGAGIGAVTTLIIQSSSATVGIVITLAKKGLISLAGAIAVMLGAELGTCADTLLATIRSDRQAIKTGLFHLGFNLISIALGLFLFPFLIQLILIVAGSTSLQQQVAAGHIIFNVLGVLLFLPFIRPIEQLLNRMIPDRKDACPSVNKELLIANKIPADIH